MKIEKHLNPNCSEAVFAIVDWEGRHIIDTMDMSSDSTDTDSTIMFMDTIIEAVKNKHAVEIIRNDGNSYHPDIADAVIELTKQEFKIDTTKAAEALEDGDWKTMTELEDRLVKASKSKCELIAEGYYGKKKGRKSNGR